MCARNKIREGSKNKRWKRRAPIYGFLESLQSGDLERAGRHRSAEHKKQPSSEPLTDARPFLMHIITSANCGEIVHERLTRRHSATHIFG
jgi:hypothetical protein